MSNGKGDDVDIDQQAEAARQQTANERAQVEQVFGLTGGELEDVAWHAEDRSVARDWTFTYWYQGVPEYVEREFDAMPLSYAPTYRTVCENEMFDMVPETVTDDEGTWKVVARYPTSGECECPLRWADDGGLMPDDGAPMPVTSESSCSLCGENPGDVHSYIYIGDGWAEIVYRLQDHDDDRALADARERLAEAQSALAGALDDDDREILSRQVARAEAEVQHLTN